MFNKFTPHVLVLLFVASTVNGSLDAKMKARGKAYFGVVADADSLLDPRATAILESDFGSITPQQSLKWDTSEPKRDEFNFTIADQVAKYAKAHDDLVLGHTLLWHSQLPRWVYDVYSSGDKANFTSAVETHVATEVGHYKNQVYSWDVVNEVFNEDGTFRYSAFFSLLGDSFVETAFKAAHTADPSAKLYINDYGLKATSKKTDAIVALVNQLQENGIAVDGIAAQLHLLLGQAGEVQPLLERLAATGLEIALTELEVNISEAATADELEQQKDDYYTVTKACLFVPQCIGITVAGIKDGEGSVIGPTSLLWDTNYDKKPAYFGVEMALDE